MRLRDSTEEEVLAEYPGLARDDIRACYLFAGKSLESTDFMPLVAAPK
ncbi:MAG TPA: DUF433 domain-containing protein [Chthonomonadaceae bacterium]|nr:DUF433 domain-containing protein [Chthonomonadaceae bacterium]